MKRDLEMFFLTNLNKKVKIVVPEPKDNLTSAQINDVMNLIMEKAVFGFPQGQLASKINARIVESNITKIEL